MQSDLRGYLQVVNKHKILALIVFVACIGSAVALTRVATRIYEAEAQLFVRQRQVARGNVLEGQTLSLLSSELIESYAAIIRTHPIAALAIDRGRLGLRPRDLAKEIVANPIVDTRLIRLQYRSSNPDLAKRTVNAVSQAFVAEVGRLETPSEANDEPAVKVSIVAPALLPDEPVSPKPALNYGLSAMLGLLLGIGFAFVAEALDRTVKDKEDVEQTLDLSVLASVPKISTRREELYLEGDNQSVFAETFRKLRTAIQLYGAESEHRTILVSSPRAREGKSTIAINLAAVYAYAGSRTILVEADLRRPKLHEHFSTTDLNGLTLALLGRISVDQAILSTSIANLSCIPAGAIPPNPAELLDSRQMRRILEDLRIRYDIVVIDAPPLLPVADATTIAPRVDGVLIVARVKQTKRDELKESAELVKAVGGHVLGVTLNAVSMDLSGGDYSYYDEEVRASRRRGLFARS